MAPPTEQIRRGSDSGERGSQRSRLPRGFLGGRILKSGTGDFALQTETPPRVGEVYPCELEIGSALVSVRGRVVWCLLKEIEKRGNGDRVPVYYAGITVCEDDLEAYRAALAESPAPPA